MLREIPRQRLKQRAVHGGVRVTKIIHRLHDAPAHHVGPDAVDRSACKPRIVRAGQPVGENRATIGSPRHADFAPARKPRRHRAAGARMSHLALTGGAHQHLALATLFFVHRGALHAVKKSTHAVVMILRPAIKGVVVALRTGQACAEE